MMQQCFSRSLTGARVPLSLTKRAINSQNSIKCSPLVRDSPCQRRQIAPIIASSAPTTPAQSPETPKSLVQTLSQWASFTARPALICCLALAAFAVLTPSAFAAAKSKAAVAATDAASGGLAAFAKSALDFVLHLDVHLGEIIARYGTTTYAILFAIVFAETGLVVTPFLPGDSLLFATGALAALGKLNIGLLMAVYITAATLGDAVNYAIGNFFGTKAVDSKLIKKEYIARTEEFYGKYGGKTVVLARFVPIVRTFAPFVAGVGSMSYAKFGLYNILGAVLWTVLCTGAGYVFGNVPAVHDNFSLVVLGIVVVSVLPVVYEVLAAKAEKKNE